MEIDNLAGFVEYCRDQDDSAAVVVGAELASELVDLSMSLTDRNQVPLPFEEDLAESLDAAYGRISVRQSITEAQFNQSSEILSRFWKHRDVFSKWHRSKVIVVAGKK